MLAKIAAIVVVAMAITAALVDMTRRSQSAPSRSPVSSVLERPDPHREALTRCREMGEAAAQDDDCLEVWAENRRRFLGISGER